MSVVATSHTFKDRLKEALKDQNITPEQLSIRTGRAFNARTVWRWLAGDSEPTVSVLPVLCPVLAVTADWLVGVPSIRSTSNAATHDAQGSR